MASLKVAGALIIVLAIDMFLFFGQTATASIASNDPSYDGNTFMSNDTAWIQSFGSNNQVNTSSVDLPTQDTVEGGDESIVFTDVISVATSWISTAGDYFFRIVGAPVHYIKVLGLPQEFTFAVGAFWYGLTAFLVVAFVLGREN